MTKIVNGLFDIWTHLEYECRVHNGVVVELSQQACKAKPPLQASAATADSLTSPLQLF